MSVWKRVHGWMTRRTRLNEPTELSCALLQVGVNVTALHDCLEAYTSAVGSDPASANAALTAVRGERAAIEPSLVNLAKAVRAGAPARFRRSRGIARPSPFTPKRPRPLRNSLA